MHAPTKPAVRSRSDNEALVQKHLAVLPAYKRDGVFSRVLHVVNDGNECDNIVRDLCVSKSVRNCLLMTANNVQATVYCLGP